MEEKEEEEEEDYPQLPEDLVEKITADHFETYSHLVAFSGVCKSWRSAALNLYNRRRHHPQPPFLPGIFISSTHCYYNSRPIRQCFLPFSEIFHGVDNVVTPPLPNFRTRRRSFLRGQKTLEQSENSEEEEEEESTPSNISVNLEKLKTKYQFTIQVDLAKYHIVASRDGWLVFTFLTTIGHLPLKMYLLNPVTGAHISLPPLRHDRLRSGKYDGGSVLLSASPDYNDDDCHVVIVTDFSDTPQVAWCNVRCRRRWKFISKDSRFINKPKSAAYIGGNLYVLDSVNSVHVFHDLITNSTTSSSEDDDAPHPNPTVRSFHFSPKMLSTPYNGRSFHHVLELNGEPIVILRHCWYKDLVTVKVYKLVGGSSSSSCCWEEVKSLEGCAVFLGNHNSMSVALNNNDNKMLKGNHIYYLDYDPDTGGGVYNLEHRKLVQRFGFFGCYRVNFCYWFSPMPWDIRKHLKKKKDKVWKWDSMQPKETIDEPTLVTHCKNRFQALSLTDDDDDDDDEEDGE